MRDLTQEEIDRAPKWAIEFSIDCDGDISWIGKDKVILDGDTGMPTRLKDVVGFFSYIKPIPGKKPNTTTKVIEFKKGGSLSDLESLFIKSIPFEYLDMNTSMSEMVVIKDLVITLEVK